MNPNPIDASVKFPLVTAKTGDPGGRHGAARSFLHLRHGTQARHGPVRRPRRLDGARHRRRPRGRAPACPDVLRARLALRHDARRDRREVRRRRRDGRLRRPAGARGRRRARGPRGARDPRRASTSSSSRRGSGSSRARSSSTTATRPSRPARPSTSPRGSSRPPSPGEILLGPGAHRLTLGRVEVEDVGPLELKGLDASRSGRGASSARARADAAARGAAGAARRPRVRARAARRTPTTARVRDRRAHLVHDLRRAGVGKSRLAREFSRRRSRARPCSSGRCLPVRRGRHVLAARRDGQVRRRASPTTTRSTTRSRSCARCCEDEAVADLLGLAVRRARGGRRASAASRRSPGPAREWAEQLARGAAARARLRGHPLGRGAAARADRAPRRPGCARRRCLIVCLARPELLDIRPAGAAAACARPRSSSSRSAASESERARRRARRGELDAADDAARRAREDRGQPALRRGDDPHARRGAAASGVERIPDTLQALIAARIDRLPPAREGAAAARGRDRPHLLARRARAPLAGARRRSRRRSTTSCCATSSLASRARRSPARRATVQARADPRGRLLRPLEGRARRAPRALRRVARRSGPATSCSRSARYHLDQRGRAARRARRRRAGRARARGRRGARRRPACARSRARRTAPRASCFLRAVELEPTLERRYLAAPRRVAPQRPPGRLVEMERGARSGAIARGRPLDRRAARSTALAEAALLREARRADARRSCRRTRSRCSSRTTTTAASTRCGSRATIAWWRGDLAEEEQVMLRGARARPRGRAQGLRERGRSTSSRASTSPGSSSTAADAAARAGARARRGERQHRRRAAGRCASPASSTCSARELDEAEAALEAARELFAEAGAAWSLGRTLNFAAWTARAQGRPRQGRAALPRVDPDPRSRSRTAATLCESQRALAELLLAQGRVDEAERFALEARETVGPHDVTLARDDGDVARARPRRAGPRRRGRGAAARGARHGRVDRLPRDRARGARGADAVPPRPRPRRRGRAATTSAAREARACAAEPAARAESPESTPRPATRGSRSPAARSARAPRASGSARSVPSP